MRLFCLCIKMIDKSQNLIIHLTFIMYNKLFNYWKNQFGKTQSTMIDWSTQLQKTITKTRNKLFKYYFKTKNKRKILYNVATLLNFIQQLFFYEVNFITDFYNGQTPSRYWWKIKKMHEKIIIFEYIKKNSKIITKKHYSQYVSNVSLSIFFNIALNMNNFNQWIKFNWSHNKHLIFVCFKYNKFFEYMRVFILSSDDHKILKY